MSAIPTGMPLRPYQLEAVNSILTTFGERNTALLVLPTGTGKTITFAELIRRMDCRTLLLAHREELLMQARDKLLLIWPKADVGIVSGETKELEHQITIGSVQCLMRPRWRAWLETQNIELIIVDEAHHIAAQSYRRVLASAGFQLPDDDPLADEVLPLARSPKLLGVTATPERGDNFSIEPFLGKPVFTMSLPEAVRDRWLCDLRGLEVSTHVTLDDVQMRGDDFAIESLSAAVNQPDRNQIIVDAWQRHATGRPTIVFTVTVQHAKDLAAAFRHAGVKAEALDGESASDVRSQVLADFEHRRVEVLCNCALFTEGFDAPATACILLARPTKSQGLYLQMIGRGTRTAPGKSNCLIIDVADTSRKHTLLNLPRLVHRAGYPEPEPASEGEGQEDQTWSLRDELTSSLPPRERQVVERELMLLPEWKPTGDGHYLLQVQTEQGVVKVWLVLKEKGYIAGMMWPDGHKQELTISAMTLGWAQALAERAIGQVLAGRSYLVDSRAAWRNKEATQNQLSKLRQLGMKKVPTDLTRGQASDLISQLQARGA